MPKSKYFFIIILFFFCTIFNSSYSQEKVDNSIIINHLQKVILKFDSLDYKIELLDIKIQHLQKSIDSLILSNDEVKISNRFLESKSYSLIDTLRYEIKIFESQIKTH
jgi:hypothetical protein